VRDAEAVPGGIIAGAAYPRGTAPATRVALRLLILLSSVVALEAMAASGTCADPCVEAARQSYRQCRQDAAGTLVTSRALCRARDPACVKACLSNEADCVRATGYPAALQVCVSDDAAAIQRCLERFTTQAKRRNQCVDQAQLQTFQCRAQARRSRRRDLARCVVENRRCKQACGPTRPPADAQACLAAAAQTNQQAIATCNQVANAGTSACADKDAACVQTCREARTACAAPFEDAIDTATEACDATRDGAVATCVATTPPGSERDACIQTADSDAFVCRDDANEAQAPGLTQCTKTYVGCVRSCPPA